MAKRKTYTDKQRDEVCLLRASGMSKKNIAEAMGFGEMELINNFEKELNNVYRKKKLQQLANLEKAANKGNVAAQKALLSIYAKGEISFVPQGQPKKEPEPKPVKIGKKEEELIEARKPPKGTSWDDHLTKQ